jgi:hypothetical protein
MIPEPPADGNWDAWVDAHYPFDPKWQQHLRCRNRPPKPGSGEQLNDLRGVPRELGAAYLAQLWFYCTSHESDIMAAKRADAEREREIDRRRLISIAKLALDGKLGDSRDDRDAAQATAQKFIGAKPPEQLLYWELSDWKKMHDYSKKITNGEHPKRPMLHRDLLERRQRERDLNDIDDSLGAVDGSLF